MITINLTVASWTTEAAAWANGPTGYTGTGSTTPIYFDETANGTSTTELEAGDTLYTDNTPFTTTLDGLDKFWYYELSSTAYVVQVNGSGVVQEPTTTTTTTTVAPDPIYELSTTASSPVDEGTVINFIVDASTGGTPASIGWTIGSNTTITADDLVDSNLWPTSPGTFSAGNWSQSFNIKDDVSFNEGDEILELVLHATDSNGVTNTGNQTVIVTITDSSVNLPPVSAGTTSPISMINAGSGNSFLLVDLAGYVTEPESESYTINITALPSNGILKLDDGTTEIDAVPTTITGSEPLKIRYYPNSNFAGGNIDSFYYKAVDSNGQEQLFAAEIEIIVNDPANQAPNATNVSISLPGVANETIGFQRAATDEDVVSVSYVWVDDSAGTNVLTLAQLNNTLQAGALSTTQGISEGFTYTSSVNLTPVDANITDVFYFRAEDSSGLSDVGQVQIQVQPPSNNAPTFNYSMPPLPISIAVGSVWESGVISTNDSEGHTVTVEIDSQVGPINATYGSNGKLTVTATAATTGISVTLKATDQYGAHDPNENITFAFESTAAPSRSVKVTGFGNSSDAVCSLVSSGTLYYYDTSANTNLGAFSTFLADLPIGAKLYSDAFLANEVSFSTPGNPWISAEEISAGTTKAIKIDSANEITEIVNCNVTTGDAWPIIVSYAENYGSLCDTDPSVIEVEVWQNIGIGNTLSDIVAAGGQLFSNEIVANSYSGSTAPVEQLVPSGSYTDSGTAIGEYYTVNEAGEWVQSGASPDPYLFECVPAIEYETKWLAVKWFTQDPTDIGSVCNVFGTYQTWADVNSLFDDIFIWYRSPKLDANGIPDENGIAPDYTLLELAQKQIRAFATQGGAEDLDYTLLQPSSVLLDATTGGFVVWDNDNATGYAGSTRWYGFDSDNILEIANENGTGSVLGDCGDGIGLPDADYVRPLLSLPVVGPANDTTIGEESPSSNSMYYVFYGCESQLNPGVSAGAEPYFPLYVIDGLHSASESGDGISYILDFIETLKTSDPDNLGERAQVKVNGNCYTYINRIIATNIEDAIDKLEVEIGSSNSTLVDLKPISINPVDLGFGSNSTVLYQQDIVEDSANGSICYLCDSEIGTWLSYTFPTLDDAIITNRNLPNFDLETNYTLDNVSKPLLRTNPKLSTNAKLVANSSDKIFIESIDATKELASVEYKKWELNSTGAWSYDLQRFYKSNYTPGDIMFATRSDYSDYSVHDSFDKQIEEVYHYGTTYNYSKIHDEDFRMLAPIWLDKDVPKKFVVFRVNDPVGELDFDDRTNLENIQDILKHSEIVKTFDLTSESSLGKYIRNHVNAEAFPKSPIQFNFAKGEKSNFRGIDLVKGGFASKPEFLYQDFVRNDSPLIASNQIISDGFQRNNLACANLINLEFLFDDDSASDYSINRYFGLYVNDIDSGSGSISTAENGNIVFKSLSSNINNEPESAIPSFKHISGTPTLGYVAVSDVFYKISSRAAYETSSLNVIVEDSDNSISSEIKLAANGKSIDVIKEDSAGFDFNKVQVTGVPQSNDRFVIFDSKESAYSIKFLRHIAGEGWKLKLNIQGGVPVEHVIATGTTLSDTFDTIQNLYPDNNVAGIKIERSDVNNTIYITDKYATLSDLEISFVPTVPLTSSTIAKVSEIQTSVKLDNSTFFASPVLPSGTYESTSFSSQGNFADIAKAITECVNNSPINFTAIIEDGADYFYVKSNIKGYRRLQSGILIPNANSASFLDVNNRDSITSRHANGLLNLSDVIFDVNQVYYMNGGNSAGKSILVTKDSVADINVGDLIATNSDNVYNKVIDIVDDIERADTIYNKIILENINTLSSGEQNVYADNVARVGLFSAYDIHDMDFDFYDISNSDLKELEFETPANINYEPQQSGANTLTVFASEFEDEPINYFTGIGGILPEEGLESYNELKLWSEYDRLQENNLKQFAVRSRVTPNINKWVLKDGTTVREQGYHLNSNEAFGRTNFSPDFDSDGRDRLGMTHEWFYLDNVPKYLQYDQLNDTFSYVNFLEGFELNASHFKSTSYNYFDRFMVTEGFEKTDSNDIKTFIKTNLQKKYTNVSGGNDASFANTIFKGIKVSFKNRKEFENITTNDFVKSSEFNGYKFSTLVMVRGGQATNDIEYEVIQNKEFGFVVFLITISMDDLWIDGSLNRKLLYEMNHSFVWNHETENFSYSDVAISGALNLNDINFTDPSAVDYLVAIGIDHVNGGLPQFLDQINPDEDGVFGDIHVTVQDSGGPVTFKLAVASIDDQAQLTLASAPVDLNGAPVNVSNIAGYLQASATYAYKGGGKNAFTSILNGMSVSSVSDLLKNNDGSIKYTTVETDGVINSNRFEIEFESGVEVIKQSMLVTVADEEKPKTFKLKQGTLGFDLSVSDTYYPFLVRHNGDYTVSTNPIVTFTDTYTHFKTNTLQSTANTTEILFEESMYKHSLTNAKEVELARDYYKKYNRCGTSFNLGYIQDNGTHDTAWGIIKNHFYRKVNETNAAAVTKLSESTDKLPLYPLIGEVAIDKKDINVFKSSWDKNYYTRSLSSGLFEQVPGTFETKEERSYLGSTIMKIKDSYNIINFTSYDAKTQEQQDRILANNDEKYDVVSFENKDYIYMDFYITSTLKKLLSSDGVLNSINKFVTAINSAGDKTTTKDDALLYVENNLLNTFNLDQIKLYTSRRKGKYSEILSTNSIDNLDDGAFSNDINFTFKSHEQQPLNFRLIYNKRLGYSYGIRPMVKIKS